MKKYFLSGILLLSGIFVYSQNYLKSENIKVKRTDESGTVKFLSFKSNAQISDAESRVLLKEILQLDNENILELEKSETDVFGSSHAFYKHLYDGVPVAMSEYTVHSRNGFVTSVNGSFQPVEISTLSSAMQSPEEIFQIGLSNLGSSYQLPDEFENLIPKSKLMVLPKKYSTVDTDRYVYVFTVVSQNPGNAEKVYIDAITGEVLKKTGLLMNHDSKSAFVPNQEQSDYIESVRQKVQQSRNYSFLEQGNADTRYSGSRSIDTQYVDSLDSFILKDEERFVNTVNFEGNDYLIAALFLAFGSTPDEFTEENTIPFTDDDNNWTTEEFEADKNDGALEAHWAFSEAYDFLKEEYDRNGFDDEDSPVTSFIHTTFFGDPNNAAWLGLSDLDEDYRGGFMFIGDGDYDPDTESGNFDILSCLDIVTHEYAHGITGAASGLIYERESGALNEGLADVWGATIEANRAPEKQRWVMGEDMVMVAPFGIRSFENPKLMGQPDTYMGQYWMDASEDCVPGTDNDNCGVHTNSGVLNHWYYLTVEGGEGVNDNNYNYDLEGIGLKKAADLIYSVSVNYLQSNSDFAEIKDFTLQEAEILYGEESEEVIAISEAWCAVGVESEDGECAVMATKDLSKNTLGIYPNPAKDILFVNGVDSLEKTTYNIFNLSGQKVMQSMMMQNKIDISSLASGVYVISLKNGEQTQTFKFVKK